MFLQTHFLLLIPPLWLRWTPSRMIRTNMFTLSLATYPIVNMKRGMCYASCSICREEATTYETLSSLFSSADPRDVSFFASFWLLRSFLTTMSISAERVLSLMMMCLSVSVLKMINIYIFIVFSFIYFHIYVFYFMYSTAFEIDRFLYSCLQWIVIISFSDSLFSLIVLCSSYFIYSFVQTKQHKKRSVWFT